MPHYPKPFFRAKRGLWYIQINGHQHNLGPGTAEDADIAAAQLKLKLRQPVLQPVTVEGDQLLIELIDKFLDYVQKNLAPDTYEWYRSRLQCWSDTYPDLTLLTLKKHHVRSWIDDIKGKPGTKRNYARAIQRCLSWCEEEDIIERSPIAKFKKPAGGKRERIINPSEYQKLLALAGSDEFRDLLIISWETGCRPQESLVVEARHVDLVHSRWFIPKDEGKKGLDHDRYVYLNDTALEMTKRLMAIYPDGPLFRNTDGEPWSTDSVNCAFIRVQTRLGLAQLPKTKNERKQVKGHERKTHQAAVAARRNQRYAEARAKGEKFCLYHFRHTWMNRLLTSGVDSLTVAVLAGHVDPTTVSTTYQHLIQKTAYLLTEAKRAG